MQNVPQGSSPPSVSKKLGDELEKSSTPQSNPIESGATHQDDSELKYISETSESEDDDVSEVDSFSIEDDADERKFLLKGACAETVDPETQEKLEALLQAAGISRLGSADGKHLADPEVLRRLTSSVSCALDEAAAALTRMRTDHAHHAPESRSIAEACSEGDVITVKKLLTEGKSVHETSEEGESLLSLACSAGYLELAQVLLAMNANVEDRGVKGDCTPLMEAASAGHTDIVKLLLNHKACVNAQSASGNTALMYACAGGHERVVELLLENAANVEDHNENGHTPLMEAASAGHVGVARILLNHGAGINTHSNEFKESALTLACYKGHLDMVRFLLEAGADQEHKTDEMHTALMEASMDGHVEVARLLLDSGAQVNMPQESFESPLTLAACGGHTELAMLLIERGANIEEVNDEGYTPLMEAAREGHEEMVALLLSQGANINAQTEETQETALTLACCGGFLEVADFLIKAGADLEVGASTPLMEAAQEGHLDLVRYLLEYHHANVNAQTQTGDTALTYACENGHTDVASLLMLYGADLEHESEGGRTPLMKACRAGHTYTVQYLISKNADVNKTTSNNDHTPLSLAASGGHVTVVELLLANRADPFHRLKDNSTMLIEAAKGGHTNVVHLLLDYPHSVMMQIDADTRKAAPAPEVEDPSLVQVQRSLLRKLRPPATTEPPANADTHQLVRPPPTGEPSAGDGESEDKTDSCGRAEPPTPYSVSHPFQVSPSTAISDRPKAKPFSKKDGKTSRKILNQPTEPSSDPTQASLTANVLPTAPSIQQPSVPTSEPVVLPLPQVTDRGDGNNSLEEQLRRQEQQIWMLQHGVHPDYPKEGGDQLDNIVLDFAHKLDPFTLEEVKNDEQDRLKLRPRQQLFSEEDVTDRTVSEEEAAFNFNAQHQDLTFITLPRDVNSEPCVPYQPREDHYPFVERMQLRQIGDEIVEVTEVDENGVPYYRPGEQVTVHRTAQGDIEVIQERPFEKTFEMCATRQEQIDFCYAEGFKMGLLSSKAKAAAAAGNVPGLTLPPRLLGAAGFSPQLLLPTAPLSSAAFCCPATPVEPPARAHPPTSPPTQVQVATQTTGEKKPYYPPALPPTKGKKVRFQTNTQRNSAYAQTSPDPGLAQCSGAFPAPCPGTTAAPTPPLQLSACMDVDSETDSNHDTALTLACAGGHEELVELLLSRGADIEHRDKKGFTPLILAATAGHEKVVEILLNHGADIEAQSERTKDTPLSLACSGGRYEVVELLLNKMANKEHRNVSDYTPLSLAASGGYVNIIKLLLNHGAEINSRTGSKLGISPLMLASMNGHVTAVKLLLDMGSDINAQIETNRNTALTLACFQGRHEVVSLLLDRKANVEHRAKTGLTPLMEAASGGYVEVGRVLIDKGADVNASPVPSSRDTALTIAADKGHVRFVELLLSRNALVEVKNKKGNSPLWLAANGGHLSVVELLYNLDADIDSQDNRKVSCLMAAFRKGHVKVVKWMVNHVTQFPSDQEMTRFIATISDKELLDKCHECVKIIRAAKDLQSAKANKNASILLEELDMEKNREESKKAAAARRRERKKKKKLEKKEEKRKMYEETRKPESEDEDDEDGDQNVDPAAEASKTDRLSSVSPTADKEEGDSGIDANSQGSCSSNDVKSKEPTPTKRKDKKKKKGADKLSDTSPPKPLQEIKENTNERVNLRRTSDVEFEEKRISSAMYSSEMSRHPAEREDFEATGNETYVPANRGRKNNTAHLNHHEAEERVTKTFTTSPKAAGKREEGWKEVVRSFPYRSKKVSVPLNAISRVIGRAGSNINAIRSATGAHIEVDKQSKGQGERTITIKGSADATKQAHNLIAMLIKDPEVDIVQMLPKTVKLGQPTTMTVSKSKSATVAKPLASLASSKLPTAINPTAKTSQTKGVVAGAQPKLSAPVRPTATTADMKRNNTGATKTTMSYTSVIMAPGKVSKPTPLLASQPIAPMKPRTTLGSVTPLVASSTAPQSQQMSPPQPLPISPRHHRPQPTSSAPPTMQQGPIGTKVNLNQGANGNPSNNQDVINQNMLNEYSLFKNSMWGREQEKQNFASVAANSASGAKYVDEGTTQVDITKAPGYRGHAGPGCSPVKPFSPYPQDPSMSPRGGEPANHSQMNMLPPMQLDMGPTASVAPIGPPMYGQRATYSDPNPMYNTNEIPYQLPSPPPIPISRLNPRAPDFSFTKPVRGGQNHGTSSWPYGPSQEILFPQAQPSVADLLSFDSRLANSPALSPHSPVQVGMATGEIKGEDRKIPRPIGTERHNFKASSHNGFDHMDPSWMPNYRPPVTPPYRNLHDDLTLLDPTFQGGISEVQYHNGTALAQQLMLAQQQVPMQMPHLATLDPAKLENWEMDKHAAYTEGWTTTKWTH